MLTRCSLRKLLQQSQAHVVRLLTQHKEHVSYCFWILRHIFESFLFVYVQNTMTL